MESYGIYALWFCLALLCLSFGGSNAQITFTGNAEFDFDPLRLPKEARAPYFVYQDPPSNSLGQTDLMIQNGWISGMDVKNIYMQYDWQNDALFVGINCYGICGDLDGDGIINGTPADWQQGMNDWPDWSLSKTISMVFWPQPPENWFWPPVDDLSVELGSRMGLFYPTFVVGKQPTPTDPTINLKAGFAAYSFSLNSNDPLLAACASKPIPYDSSDYCYSQHIQILLDPPTGYRLNLTRFAGIGVRNFPFTKKIPLPRLFAEPSADHPDIEFVLNNISNYFNFSFQPGLDPIRFGFFFQMGSTNNLLGFKTIVPQLFSIPCPLQDACGVCIAQGGDNSSCSDCDGVPFGTKTIDACGVCGGDDSSCADCNGIPNGPNDYDVCGICGGDNSTCAPCPHTSTLTFYAEDSFISMNDREANYGHDQELLVQFNRSRTLVQFRDVQYQINQIGSLRFGLHPENLEILDATLRFKVNYATWGWNDKEIAVHSLNDSFGEFKASWSCSDKSNDDCCKQWRMTGLPPNVHPSFAARPIATEEVEDGFTEEWLEFNVTDEIEDLVFNREFCSVNSYIVKKVCEHDAGLISFFSCESGTCPELVVRVRAPCEDEPPVTPPEEDCDKEDPSINWNWDEEEQKK